MTGLRDIVVVLDDTERSQVRLGIAVRLAQQHRVGACVDGPLDARGKMRNLRKVRNLTDGSDAPICPASHEGVLVKLFHRGILQVEYLA